MCVRVLKVIETDLKCLTYTCYFRRILDHRIQELANVLRLCIRDCKIMFVFTTSVCAFAFKGGKETPAFLGREDLSQFDIANFADAFNRRIRIGHKNGPQRCLEFGVGDKVLF